MKPLTLIVALLAGLAGGVMGVKLFAPAGGESAAKKETAYERVMRTGVIRCGYNYYEPALMKDPKTGAMSGFLVDLMREVGRVTELKIEWAAQVDWGQQVEDLNARKVDVLCLGSWEGGNRAKYALHVPPFSYQAVHAFVRENDTRFKTLDDLNRPGIKIGVWENTPTITAQRERFPLATAVPMPPMSSEADMMASVGGGKIDAGITNFSIGNQYIKQNPGKVKLASATPVRVNGNTLVVGADEIRLEALLASALRELQNAGVIDRLVDAYNRDYPGSFLKPAPLYQQENAR